MDSKKISLLLISLLFSFKSFAFCGFFVSKAGTDLFNKASKVIMVRDEKKTVLTMANDFQGEMKEFAMVIPVPEILERGQINVGSTSIIDHLDAYTSPRLVEYHDDDPCNRIKLIGGGIPGVDNMTFKSAVIKEEKAKKLGVKIEATYSVGEYDILILSAKESKGLVTWLNQENYKVPKGAQKIIGSYLKQGMKFFVAKVNLKKQLKLGFNFLRPLQVAYSSNKFMLPIRLGMLNAKSDQDLFVFALTKNGRVETINYKTKKLPSNLEIPTYIKKDFPKFYKDMFAHQVKKDGMKSVWLEYAWDMNWCDPCAAAPLSNSELKQLGVFWINKNKTGFRSSAKNVFVSRIHVRYNKENFPDDLQFQTTSDRKNFQGRYILRHKWTGSSSCEEAKAYRKNLPKMMSKEAQNLHQLTGRKLETITSKLNITAEEENKSSVGKWWNNIWN